MPNGLTLSSSGLISGTPTTAGTYMFTLRASNSGGSDTETFTLIIAQGSSSRIYGTPGHGDSKDDPWEIDSVTTLINLRNDVNNGKVSSGKYFKLTVDLDISAETSWVPIGLRTNTGKFSGHFDGNGHTVKINITREDEYVGLFGYAENSTIENLSIEGSIKFSTSNDSKIGGIIGLLNGGTINNCAFDGTISVTATDSSEWPNVGGIAGFVANWDDKETFKITNNSVGRKNASTFLEVLPVTNTSWVGGIVGFLSGGNKAIVVTGNYSRLTTRGIYTKTLTYGTNYECDNGTFANNTEIDTSSSTPSVNAPVITSGSQLIGVIVGDPCRFTLEATGDAPITWSVSSGSLPPGITLSTQGIITGTPTTAGTYTFTVMAQNSGGSDTMTLTLTVDEAALTIEALPQAKTGTFYSFQFTADNFPYAETLSSGIRWESSGELPDGLSINASTGVLSGTPTKAGTYEFEIIYAEQESPYIWRTDGATFSLTVIEGSSSSSKIYGEGEHGDSESDAWEINSVETLIKLRDDVNSGSVSSGKYFILTADLDISAYTDWEPIGLNSSKPFSGYFNGNEHTITVNISNSTLSYVGLFGYTQGGAIQNLSVEGTVKAEYDTNIYVGGIIGNVKGTTLNNCNFDGTVTTKPGDYSTVGGIVGFARSDSGLKITNNSVGRKDTSTVVEALPVETVAYAGGIVGFIAGEYEEVIVTGNYSRLKTQAMYTKTLTYGVDHQCDNGVFANNIEIDTTDSTGTLTSPPIITTGSGLGTFKKGDSVSVQLNAAGSTPIAWSITAGNLPTGLTMSSSGLISGTPTATGIYTFTVYASNSAGFTSSQFSMTINSSVAGTHRYQLFNESMTWTAAKAYCENLGGHLATITTQAEYDEVLRLVPLSEKRIYWLGGFRKNTSSPWEWVTGEAFSFTKWHSGEPNNLLGAECYIQLTSYQSSYDGEWGWNDENNTSVEMNVTGFICEWDEDEPDVEAPTITTQALPSGVSGEAYSAQLSATGTDPISWSTTGLPNGLEISENGLLSGTPTTAGNFISTIIAKNSGGEDSRAFRITIKEPEPTVIAPVITTDANLRTFTVGDSVSLQLEATGTSPIEWLRTSGNLPDGLAINSAGAISGTVTKAGTFSFLVSATNTAGSVSRRFSIKVAAKTPSIIAPVITSSEDLGTFKAGDKVSIQLKATGTSPITWTSDALPSGLNMSSTGLIYGASTTAWKYTFNVTAENSAGSDTKQFTLTVDSAVVAPTITTAQDLGTFKVGNSIAKLIEATGTSPFKWTATGLPSWLSINAETGMIFSTSEGNTGEFTFTVTAANEAGKDSRKFTLKMKSNAQEAIAPSITTASLPDAEVDAIYDITIKADGTSPLTWSASGLPDGLKLDEKSGKLTGSPKLSGTVQVWITAANSAGKDTKEFTLVIAEKIKVTPPKITTSVLPEATEGAAYSFQFEAEGDKVSWTATWKSLSGLSFSSDGLLSGTPSASGTYNITVKAKNTAGTDYANFTLKVNDKPNEAKKRPVIQSSKLPDAFNDFDYSYYLEAEGTGLTWRLAEGSELPQGLDLREDGEVYGTPNTSKVKTFKFKVIAKNDAGDSEPKTLSLKVVAKSPEFKESDLKTATWNKKYSYTVKVLNMKPTDWSIEGDLPEGIKFDKGKFSGKPMEVGEFDIDIEVSNGAVKHNESFTLKVNGVAPKIKGSFKKGTEGEAYTSLLKATGVTPITWEFEDLPDGLTYTPSATGEECTISGTPDETFNGKVTVTVKNGSGDDESVSKGLKMTIKALKPKFATKAIEVKDGVVDERYSFQLRLSTKSKDVTWYWTGDMPDGLTLDEDSGLLYGMPMYEDTCRFTVFAANANKPSYKAKLQISMIIHPKGTVLQSDKPEETEGPEFVNGVAYHERAEITTEMLARVANSDEVIAAVLPAIEVDEEGMYEFTVSLDLNVPEGGLLVWHSFPNGEDDERDHKNAIFLDETNDVIERVPETYSVTVSAWLEPGVIYEPIIAVKIKQ